jgi:hypothetical protein
MICAMKTTSDGACGVASAARAAGAAIGSSAGAIRFSHILEIISAPVTPVSTVPAGWAGNKSVTKETAAMDRCRLMSRHRKRLLVRNAFAAAIVPAAPVLAFLYAFLEKPGGRSRRHLGSMFKIIDGPLDSDRWLRVRLKPTLCRLH